MMARSGEASLQGAVSRELSIQRRSRISVGTLTIRIKIPHTLTIYDTEWRVSAHPVRETIQAITTRWRESDVYLPVSRAIKCSKHDRREEKYGGQVDIVAMQGQQATEGRWVWATDYKAVDSRHALDPIWKWNHSATSSVKERPKLTPKREVDENDKYATDDH